MRFDVITLLPEFVEQISSCGVIGKAAENGLIELNCWNPRDFTSDKHRTVDDRPYGGGPGMLMKVQPLLDTVEAIRQQYRQQQLAPARLIYLSPQGSPIKQQLLQETAKMESLILLCGRYEGIDERFIFQHVDEEWSIGDYVLSGGELAAMVCIDAISRHIPGVLGHELSASQDSFSDGLLDCPHYTRPEEIDGLSVPQVLLNGHHEQIQDWRDKQSLGLTWTKRPDLLQEKKLDLRQQALLDEYRAEVNADKLKDLLNQ